VHRRGTQYECDSVFSEVSGWRGSDGMEDLCEKHGTRHSVERIPPPRPLNFKSQNRYNQTNAGLGRASAVLRMGHILP